MAGRGGLWLVLHGEVDDRIPLRHATDAAGTLRDAGVQVTYVPFPGEDHFLIFSQPDAVFAEVAAWAERSIPPPRSMSAAGRFVQTLLNDAGGDARVPRGSLHRLRSGSDLPGLRAGTPAFPRGSLHRLRGGSICPGCGRGRPRSQGISSRRVTGDHCTFLNDAGGEPHPRVDPDREGGGIICPRPC